MTFTGYKRQGCLEYYCLKLLKNCCRIGYLREVHTGCYEGTKELPIDTIYVHLLSDLPLVFIIKKNFFQRTTYLEEVRAGPASLLHCNSILHINGISCTVWRSRSSPFLSEQ